MRSSMAGGRFRIPYEMGSILNGMSEDLRRETGAFVQWWVYDSANSVVDPVYDVGDYAGGRRWKEPSLTIPCVAVAVIAGQTLFNTRGYYQTGSIEITLDVKNVDFLLPDLYKLPDQHMLDRVVYQSTVFTPTQIKPMGHVADGYAVVSVGMTEVNPEELVNDPQFQDYAS